MPTKTLLALLGISASTAAQGLFAQHGEVVLAVGDQVPGLPAGITVYAAGTSGFDGPTIDENGTILVRVRFQDTVGVGGLTGNNDRGYMLGHARGDLSLVVRADGPAPGIPGATLRGSSVVGSTEFNSVPSISPFGEILYFQSSIHDAANPANTPPTSNSAIFYGPVGGLTKVCREGEEVPFYGPGSGIRWGQTSTGWSARTSHVREGMPAPGFAPSVLMSDGFGNFSPYLGTNIFTRSGTTTFRATLFDGGATITTGLNERAIYYGGLAGWTLVAQMGDPVPAAGAGVTLGDPVDASIRCNDAGMVVFTSNLVGSTGGNADDSALFVGPAGGSLAMIARERAPVLAAGLAGTWTFGDLSLATNTPALNDAGELFWHPSITDGTTTKTVHLVYAAELGWRCVLDGTEVLTTPLGAGSPTSFNPAGIAYPNTDGAGLSWWNDSGDWVATIGLPGPQLGVLARGHVGKLIGTPSAISGASGGSQFFALDAGPSHAFQFYAILGSISGTRPGFVLPFGPTAMPLNFDVWTQLSVDLFDTILFTNTLWITDANGRANASLNVPPAAGLTGFLLHHAALGLDFNLVQTFVTEPVALHVF